MSPDSAKGWFATLLPIAQQAGPLLTLLLALLRQFSGTMIMVTHDIAEAIILADRVVVFSQRPATVTASYEVKLGNRQRKSSELRTDPEFARLFERIWQDIEQEFIEQEFAPESVA